MSILLLLCVIISGNPYKGLKKGQSVISFASSFENDTINVKVNDSIGLQNHKIDMIFEWRIFKNTTIYVNGKEFKISGNYKTTETIDEVLGIIVDRTLYFDTILKAKNGRNIFIGANENNFFVT